MHLAIREAVETLDESAGKQAVEPRLRGRLADVQAMLSDDLAWLERALAEIASVGPAPATDAARHLVSQGGKRVRPMALLLSAACFGEVPARARELGVVAELVHSATLLHDDVIDDGTERRGAPAARRLWTNAVSVLAGDLLLVHALEQTGRHAPEVLPSLISTLRLLVDGEIIQLRGRSALDVSEATYDLILRGKTASLFRWATATGARIGGAPPVEEERLAQFGEEVGMAFQLVDDVLDYEGDGTDKTFCADLREGKLTLPLVLAVQRDPRLVDPLRTIHGGDDAPVEEVRGRVLAAGVCADVRRRAADHTSRAVGVLRRAPPGPARALLESVALELVARHR